MSFNVTPPTTSIAFVLDNIQDYETIVSSIPVDTTVFVIDSKQNALEQMASISSNFSDLSSIHIFSHASQANLDFGNVKLNEETINNYSDLLSSIGSSLTNEGDILLYGCNVAEGSIGAEFIGKLAQATGADIAASDDPTGNSALGGDWVLEERSGDIEAATIKSDTFSQTLSAPVFSNDTFPADGEADYWATVLVNSNASTNYTMWTSASPTNVFFYSNSSGSNNNDLTGLLNIKDITSATSATWTIVTGPAHGTLTNTLSTTTDASGTPSSGSGSLIYTPESGYTGSDSIVVTATTAAGTTTPMTIGINVINQHELGGVAATGNLDVHVDGGNLYITRYDGSAWQQQYFAPSGALINVDGKQYALGTYYVWGTTHAVEEAEFVSQTKSGTQITTTWNAGGFLVNQLVDLPSTTSKYIKLNYTITNNSGSDASDVRFFRGIDSYLAGGDSGAGFWDADTNTIGVTKDSGGVTQVLRFQGITTPTWYSSKMYGDVGLSFIDNNVLLNDVDPTPTTDNGYALGWQNLSLTNNSSWTIKTYESFTSAPVSVSGGDLETSTGGAVTLTYTVSNKSGSSQNVTYSVVAPSGWSVDSLSTTSETIANNTTSTVTVTLTPQAGETVGLYDVTLNASTVGGDAESIGQVNVEALPGPTITALTAIALTDTSANDTFSNSTGTISATGTITGYGINSGTTGGTDNISGTVYDVSKAGTYGTLYVNSTTGAYVYVPNASAVNGVSANQSETFSVQATDSNGTGSATLSVNVTGANDTPSLNAPTAANYTDTTAGDTFTNTTGTLSVNDRDTGTTFTYGITGGTTGGSTNVGGTVYDVSKAGTYGTLYVKSSDGSYVFVPSNSALNGAASGATPTDTFTMSVSDGTATVTQTYTVNITGANDAPTISTAPSDITVTEDSASNVDISALTLSDVDGDAITVTLTASAGTMAASSGGGVTVGGSASGTLTLSGTASDIDTFLNTASNIQYTSASNASGNNAATITISASDGNGGVLASNPVINIDVTNVNDTPTLNIGELNSFTASNVVIAPNLTLTDPENDNLTQAKIQINNFVSGDILGFTNDNSTMGAIAGSYDSRTGILTLSGTATVSQYEAALKAITFSKSNTDATDRSFSFTLGSAIPFQLNGQDHFYEVIDVTSDSRTTSYSSGIKWTEAKTFAETLNLYGMQGYLATITSTEENIFILNKLNTNAWIGASDSASEGAWKWISGPEAGTQFWSGGKSGSAVEGEYANWNLTAQPDNWTGLDTNGEDYAEYYGTNNGLWNDLSSVDKLNYLIIEYGGMNEDASPMISQTATMIVNDTPTGSVTINGTPTQGQTLTASNTLADSDGLGTISYQWKANGEAIEGATESTLVLGEAHVGKVITVVASYTDGHETAESKTSNATTEVANTNDSPTGSVTISGTPAQGQTLTASNTLADSDGLGTISYQWKANGEAIEGATESTLVLGEAHVGKVITVVASYTDGHETAENKTSDVTAAVAAPTPPPPSNSGGSYTPPPTTPSATTTIDGTTVQTTTTTETRTTTDTNGHTTSTTVSTEQVVIAPITSSRVEDRGVTTTADIPLFWGESSRTEWATTASLPTGIGLNAKGDRAPTQTQTKATVIDDLIYYIDTTTPSTDSGKSGMLNGGETFLNALSHIDTLVVNKITLSADTTTAPTVPITIQGVANTVHTANGDIAPMEALVIDAQTLPTNSTLQLQNIEFAVIIGENLTIRGGEGQNKVFTGEGSQDIMCGEDDDELHAGAGDDTVGSADGDDLIFGEAGNDTVFGGEGNDMLHGGSETDIATYSSNIADYIITRDEGKTYVALASNPNEVDTIINVETIEFADTTYTIQNRAELTKIATLYMQVLDRQADINGFQYWAHTTLDMGQTALDFIISSEYKANSGVDFDTLDLSGKIETFYEALLGRSSDAEGKAHWINAAQSGTMTINQIAESFLDSVEMQGLYLAKDGWNFFM